MAVNFGTTETTVNLESGESLVPGSGEVLVVTSSNMDIKARYIALSWDTNVKINNNDFNQAMLYFFAVALGRE